MSTERLASPPASAGGLPQPGRRIRVKLISTLSEALWRHQFPRGEPIWGNCVFVFDRRARDYDWLVVYDDLPALGGEAKRMSREKLASPRAHSVLVTTEPASIKMYGDDYTRQFGWVLTSQPEWALPHPGRIVSQPALHWFYGVGSEGVEPFERILAEAPKRKQDVVTMVHSAKAMRHTLHYHRAHFMHWLRDNMPELRVFGRDTPHKLDDKADCLRDFRYHVAIENYVGSDHWTEKLADAFLGLSLPFYYGCPNAADYFPEDSFIRIDIHDPGRALEIMRRAVRDGEYAKRLPAIIEARRRVMFEHNLFAVLTRHIEAHHPVSEAWHPSDVILSRRALRASSPAIALRDLYGKLRGLVRHLPSALTGRPMHW